MRRKRLRMSPCAGSGRGWSSPIRVRVCATIPPDTAFTRNLDNRSHVGELTNVSTVVASTQTSRNFGPPYVLHGRLLVFGDGSPLLTLEPGVELQFGSGSGLHVCQH